jgi:hypothetical protein
MVWSALLYVSFSLDENGFSSSPRVRDEWFAHWLCETFESEIDSVILSLVEQLLSVSIIAPIHKKMFFFILVCFACIINSFCKYNEKKYKILYGKALKNLKRKPFHDSREQVP